LFSIVDATKLEQPLFSLFVKPTGQKFFRSCRSELDADCGTVLLSGEDFENAVVDLTLASDIEADAQAAGFSEIVWVFVTRDKHDYAASIYAEMSKHNIVLQQGVVEEAMEKRGCLYVSTYNYNYIFALDFQRFTDRFMETLSGELWEFSMKDFLAISPGAALLRVLMGQYQYDRFVEVAQFYDNVENKRLKSDMVETEYLATALGLTQERRNKLRWRLILSIARSLKVRR